MDNELYGKEQAERCRRLARQINDLSTRNTLERLAEQYEASVDRPPRSGKDRSAAAN